MRIALTAPGLAFERLSHTGDDFEFALEAKRLALGPYIVERWGWDADFQSRVHAQRMAEKPFDAICHAGERVGTVSFMEDGERLRLGEFYIVPERQRQGIGTAVLRACLNAADELGRTVWLEHLNWNPVGLLYERNGFVRTRESETHWFLERLART